MKYEFLNFYSSKYHLFLSWPPCNSRFKYEKGLPFSYIVWSSNSVFHLILLYKNCNTYYGLMMIINFWLSKKFQEKNSRKSMLTKFRVFWYYLEFIEVLTSERKMCYHDVRNYIIRENLLDLRYRIQNMGWNTFD